MPLSVRPDLVHPWQVPDAGAADIQHRLASAFVSRALPAQGTGAPRLAAGVDVGYSCDGHHAWAAAVVLDERLHEVERRVVAGEPDRAYATGMLAFREGRLSLEALLALECTPELLFVDGHGVVHERGCGLATHLGVLLDTPTIGVPKTPFHAVTRPPETPRGSTLVLTKEWGAQGAAVRLRTGTKPVYVSPGHLVDLESAIALALRWSTGRHRVPEPLQAADTLSKLARRERL